MTVYIRPEDRDTRYDLWFVTYPCKVPQIQMRSIDDIRNNGTYVSGNKAYDHASAWEQIRVSIPIVRMVEHWANGANIYVIDLDKHARQIYNAIEAHLNAWGNHMDRSYNTRNVPEEDLIALDEFGMIMWQHAKWIDVKKIYNGLLQPKRAVPSIGSLAAFWNELDRKRAVEKEDQARHEKLNVQEVNFGGISYVKDTDRMLEEIKKHMDQGHVGRNAIDIYARRESFVDRMKESGHFRNYKRK